MNCSEQNHVRNIKWQRYPFLCTLPLHFHLHQFSPTLRNFVLTHLTNVQKGKCLSNWTLVLEEQLFVDVFPNYNFFPSSVVIREHDCSFIYAEVFSSTSSSNKLFNHSRIEMKRENFLARFFSCLFNTLLEGLYNDTIKRDITYNC